MYIYIYIYPIHPNSTIQFVLQTHIHQLDNSGFGPNESVPTYLCFLFPFMVIIQNPLLFTSYLLVLQNLVDSASTFAHDAGRKQKLFLTVQVSGPNIHGSKLPDHHGDAQHAPIPSCSVTTW